MDGSLLCPWLHQLSSEEKPSEVDDLRCSKPEAPRSSTLAVSAISLFIGLVKRRPALNSSPSCCMRARLTGHEGKSRRSWPRFGSELRKVLAIFLSHPPFILSSSCCLLYPYCLNLPSESLHFTWSSGLPITQAENTPKLSSNSPAIV